MKNVRLIVFLRTDLFELYDIQEKTKLVPRTFTIEWTEEEWLQGPRTVILRLPQAIGILAGAARTLCDGAVPPQRGVHY